MDTSATPDNIARSGRRGFLFRLKDGTDVFITPVLRTDRGRIQRGVRKLSAHSKYLRFFSVVDELSESQLDALTDLDGVSNVAWAALDPASPTLEGLGLGRFARDANDPLRAEMAVAVLDEMQGKGLGGTLVGVLYLVAGALGITTLRSLVLPDNVAMVRWLGALGAQAHDRGTHYEIDLFIAPPGEFDDDTNAAGDLPDTPQARRFRQLLHRLRAELRTIGAV